MTKKDVIWGSLVIIVVGFSFFSVFTNVAERFYGIGGSFRITETILKVFVGFVFVSSILITVFGMQEFARKEPKYTKPEGQMITVTIPVFFLIPLIIITNGGFIVLLGCNILGYGLACLGFPALLIFFLIALRKIAKDEEQDS